MSDNPQYWVVGASWSGRDKYDDFVNDGYWQLHQSGRDKPLYIRRFNQVRTADSIALKSTDGPGTGTLTIKAIGLVTDVDVDNCRLEVNWVRVGLERKMPLFGSMKAIEGPFAIAQREQWLNQIFRI